MRFFKPSRFPSLSSGSSAVFVGQGNTTVFRLRVAGHVDVIRQGLRRAFFFPDAIFLKICRRGPLVLAAGNRTDTKIDCPRAVCNDKRAGIEAFPLKITRLAPAREV